MRKFITTLLILAGITALMVIASDTADEFTCDPDAYTVTYGDTLWAIAERNCDGNIQFVTDNLVTVYGSTIHNGQVVWLPESDDCLLSLGDDGKVYDCNE